MTVSLVITTYNWKEALKLSLSSVFGQKVLPMEILVADDGSREDTRLMIEEMQKKSPVPIVHVWQEDKGFRLSAIRNRAIAQAKGDYIIQIDGDIILNRYFISDHLELAEKGCFVCGSRILLDDETTQQLLDGQKDPHKLFKWALNNMRSRWLRHYLAFRYAKNNFTRMRGSNMAFWRKDLMDINGYNEDFVSWGYEDWELAYRLIYLGDRKKFLKMGGVSFHLHHGKASREGEEVQRKILESIKQSKQYWTENGLDKYL